MNTSIDIAKYFLSKDPQHILFNKELRTLNGRTFYEGNARLNKYLHMAQNIYIAKEGKLLFSDSLYAYDNGAVAIPVQESYSLLLENHSSDISGEIASFLDKIYTILENASLDELIELSHEDSEWVKKKDFFNKSDQKMDSLAHIDEYKQQYSDIIKWMERMEA